MQLLYVGKHRENGQNSTFGFCEPLNGTFHANFAPWPQEVNTRDFLIQVSLVKIFSFAREAMKGSKITIFVHFWAWSVNFCTLNTLKTIFGAVLVLLPNEKHLRNDLIALSHPWCNTFCRYGATFNLRNTWFLSFLDNNHLV